jgi:Tol biopolymer transport system component
VGVVAVVAAGAFAVASGCGRSEASSGGEASNASSERPATRALGAASPAPPWSDIAFGFGGRIYVMRPDGSGRRRLTGGPVARDVGVDFEPAWSPDATTMAFTRSLGEWGISPSRIYLLNPDDGRPRPLDVAGDVSSPAWSPDARQLAFVRHSRSEIAIVVADVGGGGEQVLVRDSSRPEDRILISEPTWSADGARIAYTRTTLDRRFTFRPSLYVVDVDGGDTRLLARDARDAAWSPDGSRIAFASVRDRNGKDCWDQCHLRAELYVMDADGANAVRLTRNRGDDRSPSWSPDGRRISFASDRNYPGVGNTEIYSIRADGSCLTWLTNGAPASNDPAWRNAPHTSSRPGGCGATRRPPRAEVDTRGLSAFDNPPAYWLGERHRDLLLTTVIAERDHMSLRSHDFIYDDCARYHARACPRPLQLQEVSVCSRSGLSTLTVVDETIFTHPVRARAARGLLLVSIGQGDLTVIVGRAHVRIFPGVGGASGRRQTLGALRALHRVGAPDAPLPAPALPRKFLRTLDRTARACRRFGSIGATARALGLRRMQVRRRLHFAQAVRSLPSVRALSCPRR